MRDEALPTAAAFIIAAVLVASSFHSTAWGHPGPRLAAREAPAGPASTGMTSCGGMATAPRGVLQTPDFPRAFPVPLRCTWVIDASSTRYAPESAILVRLTQVFVAGGLRFESFTHLDVTSVAVGRPWWSGVRPRAGRISSEGRQLIFDSDFGSSPPLEEVAWIRSTSPYLVITLAIDSLEGSHIRDLGVLLDVYGLNMTYEVVASSPKGVTPAPGGRRRQGKRRGGVGAGCSLLGCSVAGHCLANRDLSRYRCSCFEGHFGSRCQYSRECDPARNVSRCHNGGKCRHVGSTAIRCECPKGFYGPLCEIRRSPKEGKDPDSGVDGGRRRKAKVHPAGTPGGTRECPECESIQCPFDGTPESVCNCHPGYKVNKGDRWLFEGTFRIANFTYRKLASTPPTPVGAFGDFGKKTLEKQLKQYLKNQNISRVSAVNVGTVSEDGEVSFSLPAGEDDESRVRAALDDLVREMRHSGELLLAPDSLHLRQRPALLLLRVALDVESVAPGGGFAASCVAQGSSAMEFRWYKDGHLVDHTIATRHMWQRLLADDRPDTYTAILRVTEASAPEDIGALWCHVSDGGRQQCGRVLISEAGGPHRRAYVRPRAPTIPRGSNLTLACTSPASSSAEDEVVGFSWRKDGAPLTAIPGKEVVEALYPSGSLLRIYDAQKSAIYSCHMTTNSSTHRNALPKKLLHTPSGNRQEHDDTAHVAVFDPEDPTCPQESSWGIVWPETAFGQQAAIECPTGYPTTANHPVSHTSSLDFGQWGHFSAGNAWVPFQGSEVTRVCGGAAKWEEPDFSRCEYEPLRSIQRKFRRLTLGYLATSPDQSLQELTHWLVSEGGRHSSEDEWFPKGPHVPLRSHSSRFPILLPGQAGPIIYLLEEVQSYISNKAAIVNSTPCETDVDALSYKMLKTLDLLLHELQDSIIDPEVLCHIIHLVHRQSLLWGRSLDLGALISPVQYPTKDHGNTSAPDLGMPSSSLFVYLKEVTDGVMKLPGTGQSFPPWFLGQVEAKVSLNVPTAVNVSEQLEEKVTGSAFGSIPVDANITSPSTPQPHTYLFSLVAFKGIRIHMSTTKQFRDQQWGYQLASHVIAIDLRDQLGHQPEQSFVKASPRGSRDLMRQNPTTTTSVPLNLTLKINFSLETQRINSGLLGDPKGKITCGYLKEDGVGASTSNLLSVWEMSPPISQPEGRSPSSGQIITCHFNQLGAYAVFIAGKLAEGSLGHDSSPDTEGRRKVGDEGWRGVLNGDPGSGGELIILALGYGTCLALCLLTLLRLALSLAATFTGDWETAPADLPPSGRSSPPRGHIGREVSQDTAPKGTTTERKRTHLPLEFYLEMLFCITVIITMTLFSYGSIMLSPLASQLYVLLSLEWSLLAGMASLLGIVVIQYIELSAESKVAIAVPSSSATPVSKIRVRTAGNSDNTTEARPWKTSSLHACWLKCPTMNKLQSLSHLRLIIVGITTGVPMLCVLVLHIIERICSSNSKPSWWLTTTSSHFSAFVALASMLTLLFIALSLSLLWQLHCSKTQKEKQVNKEIREKEPNSNCITNKRVAVLWRTVFIFSSTVAMELSSILYINLPISSILQWIFSTSCLSLGVAIFVSYGIRIDKTDCFCKRTVPNPSLHIDDQRWAWLDCIICSKWLSIRQGHPGTTVGEVHGTSIL